MNNFHPSIYEINARIFLKRFGEKTKLDEIPDSFIDQLSEKCINYLWVMGVWKTSASSIEKHCFDVVLIKEYDKALKNWTKKM